jgi:hypothetical protein
MRVKTRQAGTAEGHNPLRVLSGPLLTADFWDSSILASTAY